MNLASSLGAIEASGLKALSEDGERLLCRGWRDDGDRERTGVLAVLSASEHPTPAFVDRLAHEYELKNELERGFAAQPLALVRERGMTMLLLEDPGGEPLDRMLVGPLNIANFCRLAVGLSAALRQVHEHGLVHKDIKPANVLVHSATGQVWLTGFGIASRLPRERQSPDPPESIAGTLAYMAPEQTGRMNRSIDSRSDLYSLGVVLYEILTGALPFTASDPMEWVHCHIAKQPVAPTQRSTGVPAVVSAIVLKLLAKTAEERYQTAAGVESDLRRCLAQWSLRRRIDDFPLGEHDTSDRLLIPEKLYGRATESETLLAAFDRVVAGSAPELVLVSGYSGIGKSSVVNELHKILVQPPRGLFATGKFDQYKRDIPYATLAQAFRSLVRRLLGKSEVELESWRKQLRQALDPSGSLIVDLVPELQIIIGAQPPVPHLPPQEAQNRFQLVFRRFINVFARPEHPLALFLDDLQWLDTATLDLLEHLLTHPEVRHLLLIGAYRSNEVDSAHPLTRKLEAIRETGSRVQEIILAPLSSEDLGRLLADTLQCTVERVAPLAQLIHEKTEGNPFFAIQFVSTLAEEALLTFDHHDGRWSWDLNRIHAKGYTANVVDLMVGKLNRLPTETQKALQQLACMGNSADFTLLGMVYAGLKDDMHGDLWEAVRTGLISRSEGAYRFVHDRVQEAAYLLIPDDRRASAHLRIGRLLAAHTPPEKREEMIFEIVNQLNRASALISSQDERDQLAEFDLIAGKRAKASTAYASALNYLVAGTTQLGDDCWERQRELAFSLKMNLAECEFLTGELAAAEERLAALSTRAGNTVERAAVACLCVDLYTTLDQGSRAIAVGLDFLRHLGIEWSPHPTEMEARREYERVWSLLGSRTIESLIELPLMSDPASLATLDVLAKMGPPAFYTDANLLALIACRAVNLSIERGNGAASCSAYMWLSMLAGPHFGDYRNVVYRFGQLGYDLAEARGLTRFQPRTFMDFGGSVLPWTRHVRAGRDIIRRAFEAANKIGDLTCAVACGNQLTTSFLAAGDPLAEAEREAVRGLAFAQKARFGTVIDIIATQLALIRTLRGLTPTFGSFDDGDFDEHRIERHLSENPDLAFVECWYWIRKLQARFFAGDYTSALEASKRAHRLLWTSASMLETADYHFYGALSRAASGDSAAAGKPQQRHLDAVAAHYKQLQLWAANCPENFDDRVALVGAELAHLEGRDVDAMHLFERAIRTARANGFTHQEALANELAGRFYVDRGLEKNGHAHLRDARACYALWGADGKVRQLDRRYPQLAIAQEHRSTATIGAPLHQLDLASVLKASQAVSSEIQLPKLIERLMKIALENAGADRGVLILPGEHDHAVEAEARAAGDQVEVWQGQNFITGITCPESLIRYVIRTHESVILEDAFKPNPFSEDDYLRRQQVKSILCLPLIKQGRLTGVLYLENTLTSHAFSPDRIAILKLLAAQAAISLENTRLYSDLQEREAKIRRLVDSNIIGIFIWSFEGKILEANDAFLRMLGYDREDVTANRLRWTDLTPPEWQERDAQLVEEIKKAGHLLPFEKEYFRKDGSRTPVLIGVATIEAGGDQGVAFVLDLTERKEAEKNLRETERRYREAQAELAHVTRVTTAGELTASIAHEVNQPLAAVLANAEACQLWLDRDTPNLDGARRSLEWIVKDGHRAAEVIRRVRGLLKKSDTQMIPLNINDVVNDVRALVQRELLNHQVSLRTELAPELPTVCGDRVQLQQVIINLVINGIEAMQEVTDRPRELTLRTRPDEDQRMLVTVKDCGIGISPAHADRLFNAFFTTKSSGMGMGLSICRSIIEAHGGRVWAEPNLPQGAIFHFTLPLHREDSP
jgi:PAS domain S-box-containing protein